ncbi:hypothetical protein FAIPA1_340012 [Frankia sp. AiPs1]
MLAGSRFVPERGLYRGRAGAPPTDTGGTFPRHPHKPSVAWTPQAASSFVRVPHDRINHGAPTGDP